MTDDPYPLQRYDLGFVILRDSDDKHIGAGAKLIPASQGDLVKWRDVKAMLELPTYRGSSWRPCEDCGATKGNTLNEGNYRCNVCGYPGK